MGGAGHQLEENGANRNDPKKEAAAPLDSGADGGPMDDAAMGLIPTDEDAGERTGSA